MTRANSVRCPQWFLSFVFVFVFLSVPLALAENPDVIKGSRKDVSPPLSRMAIGSSSNGGGSDSQTPTARATGAMITDPNSDPVAAPLAGRISNSGLRR